MKAASRKRSERELSPGQEVQMKGSRKDVFFGHSMVVVTASAFLLVGCGQGKEKKFQPYVTEVDGMSVGISAEDAKVICETQKCEENQKYYSSFGRKKRSESVATITQPVKEPPTSEGPPTYTPSPQPFEYIDYSKTMVRLPEAWTLTEGDPNIVVAVIDSGISYVHPDLVDNLWVNQAEKNGSPGVDDDGNGYVDDVYGWDFYNNRPNNYDDNGHGTHCAGIIAAKKDNYGTRGAAPKVKVMGLKFLNAEGSGETPDAVNAIRYAVRNGAKIISASWGGGGVSDQLRSAIAEAVSQGVHFVAAAGNESTNNDLFPTYPSSYPGVVSVGSSDGFDQLSGFSNYGTSSVKVVAPGSGIYSTYPVDRFRTMNGTSMATPQVAGILALGIAYAPTSTLQAREQALCQSGGNRLRQFSTCGRIDAKAFLDRLAL